MKLNQTTDSEFLRKITEIILANLADEHFRGLELAREAGISRSNLNRRLKSIINKSAGQYIRETRLQKAMEMLQQEEEMVSEIAYRVGFSSPAHFNFCFHHYFGFTPGEARKRIRPEIEQEEGSSPPGAVAGFPGAESAKPETGKKNLWIGRRVVWTAAIVLFSFILIYLLFATRTGATFIPCSITGKKSIAVLPFLNDSHDTANVYFINGITEAITDKLANISDLKVTSRFSAEKYRYDRTKSIPRIARELGACYIVEGSGQKIGDEVLVSVQLIEARSDKHILSHQFTRKYEDVFNLYT